MCYSFEASITSFVFGVVGSAIIFNLGGADNKIFGLYFGYVSLMQGIEAILWRHQTCDDFHKNITSLGAFVNMSQPLFLLLASRLFYPSNKNAYILYASGILYTLYEIYHFIEFQKVSHCTTPRKNDPHLVWSWLNMHNTHITWFVYLTSIFTLFVFGMPRIDQGIYIGTSGVLLAVVSAVLYPGRSVGSIWCFFSAFIPVIYIISKYIK